MPQTEITQTQNIALLDRMRGAIWGQFTGDAACLGSHWIYDPEELTRRYPEGVNGFEAPAEGHYHAGKVPGDLTHYGDAALLLLDSVADNGRFDAADFGRRFVGLMDSPSYHGYRDHATKGTLANWRAYLEAHPGAAFPFQQGADDDQPATATRLAPVVVAHHRNADLLQIAARATRVCQNNERAIAYMRCHAMVLSWLLAGKELVDVFEQASRQMARFGAEGEEVAARIQAALEARALSVAEATATFGSSCPLAQSFPAAIHAAISHRDNFSAAILATARAGGDNAGRAAMIGAWLGASLGIAGVPAAWQERLTARTTINSAVEDLLVKFR